MISIRTRFSLSNGPPGARRNMKKVTVAMMNNTGMACNMRVAMKRNMSVLSRHQVNVFPQMIIEHRWKEISHAEINQCRAEIKIDRHNENFIHENSLGFLENSKPLLHIAA